MVEQKFGLKPLSWVFWLQNLVARLNLARLIVPIPDTIFLRVPFHSRPE